MIKAPNFKVNISPCSYHYAMVERRTRLKLTLNHTLSRKVSNNEKKDQIKRKQKVGIYDETYLLDGQVIQYYATTKLQLIYHSIDIMQNQHWQNNLLLTFFLAYYKC